MADTPESVAAGLEQIAQYNAQGQYSSSHYGSPMPGMSPYSSYPDPAQMVSDNYPRSYPTEDGGMMMNDICLLDSRERFDLGQSLRKKTDMIAQNSSMYASTPNTTPSSPHGSLTRTTRSGRLIGSDPLGPRSSGVQKAISKAKPKAKKKKQKEKTGPLTVHGSLTSVLAYLDPKMDKDIDAYVNRSVDTRQNEVKNSKDGKIKRPMNAFMLYRKGFQNRIKEHQKNENHQGVSKVAGDGWRQEPEEVKDQFNHWSEVERQLHATAFPSYKFKPAKSFKNRSKSGDMSDVDESDLEDNWSGIPAGGKRIYVSNEDPDAEYRPSGLNNNRIYNDQYSMSPSRHMSQSPYQSSPYPHHQSPPPMVHNMSHYQYSNAHKPLPHPYPMNGTGHYHSQRVEVQQHQLSHAPGSYSIPPQHWQSENVYYDRRATPAYETSSQQQQQQHHMGQYLIPGQQHPYYQDISYQPPMPQSQYPTPGTAHNQSAYAAPPNGHAQYMMSAPDTPNTDGVDNFALALDEMGSGGFEDQFSLSADMCFDPNLFTNTDNMGMIDPTLEGNDWTTEPLPPNALERPDDFLDRKDDTIVVAPAPLSTPISVNTPRPDPDV